MAFQSHRTRFKGDLAGVKQQQILELDYDKTNIKDRMEYIKNKYSEVEKYHEEYTSDYYKVELNSNDNLSSDINIFKAIERDANYLLNSLDVPKDKQHKYNMLSQEEFDRVIKREQKADLFSEEFTDMLKPAFKNEFTNMDLKITNKDITEASEMGRILREYDVLRTHLKDEMQKIKNKKGSYLNVAKAKLLLGTLNCDMLDVKKSYKGITRPSTKLGDIGTVPDYDAIKYSNPAHIKAIISTVKFGDLQPDSEFSHLAYDMEVAIKKLYKNGKIDDVDLNIVECLNAGYSERKIAEELGREKKTIAQRIDKICRRIANNYTYFKIVES